MTSVEYIRDRINELQLQILDLHKWAIEKGLDAEATAGLLSPYNDMIAKIYAEDMPFARTMDESDLVIRAVGPSVEERATHLNSVDSLFNLTRKQVQRLAKAIAGISDVAKPIPKDVDLLLTGTAPGSFIFGVSLPAIDEKLKQLNHIARNDDPVYLAMRDALQSLSVVALHVDDKIDDVGLAKDVPDPGVRDALMSVAMDMSPTGKKGINKISLYSRDRNYDRVKPLTPDTRRMFRSRVNAPLIKTHKGEFIGTVREVDLDADRFEIRGVKEIGGIRCIFRNLTNHQASNILGSLIKVKGNYVTDSSGRPRLIEVETISPVPRPIQDALLEE